MRLACGLKEETDVRKMMNSGFSGVAVSQRSEMIRKFSDPLCVLVGHVDMPHRMRGVETYRKPSLRLHAMGLRHLPPDTGTSGTAQCRIP